MSPTSSSATSSTLGEVSRKRKTLPPSSHVMKIFRRVPVHPHDGECPAEGHGSNRQPTGAKEKVLQVAPHDRTGGSAAPVAKTKFGARIWPDFGLSGPWRSGSRHRRLRSSNDHPAKLATRSDRAYSEIRPIEWTWRPTRSQCAITSAVDQIFPTPSTAIGCGKPGSRSS